MASTGEGREVTQGWISLPSSDEGQISEATAEMAVGNKGIPTYRKQKQTRQGNWPDELGRWKKMCSFYSQEAVDDVSLEEARPSCKTRGCVGGGGQKTRRYDPNRENRSEVVPVHRSKKNDRYHSDLSRVRLVQEQQNASCNQPYTPRIRYRVPSVPPEART
ncbi:hypothetical protein NEUTE1DRAFT_102043 [Neurospora tetrasperma FGSC 2508]|uniref:Uncharacterized protein n=1 Tax=Neurospora tetrasperma (strain FGSC 2508 / ATCC MYA-4615 / P0657) TaxID=510951 RepID=F8MQZ7_NEUT8|nr:uncharacterized protein NEUTE1DRAFT_102043 [Neurospora tetrasperma FGSC 2508]EGO56777.1 hypothetical protein NEUTE1DRAFT_102043 [Neurospora tetrasperma FGSC 2508]